MVCTCVFITPAFSEADLPFEGLEVSYLVSAMPHFSFTRVSSCITALITLERCLSIAIPLKVKMHIYLGNIPKTNCPCQRGKNNIAHDEMYSVMLP